MRRWVKWFGLLLLLAVGAVILINQFDEPPDPAAVAASTPRSPRVADGQNGYLRLLALGADDGADGMAYAQVWLDEARAAAREHRVARKATAKRAERPELCDPARVSCLSAVRDKPEEHAQSLLAWREDIARYESLLASTAYEEVLDYPQRSESRLPDYAKAGTAQRAWLLRAALAVHEARVEEALGAVERDIAFQRVMLAGTRTLIGRMVAAALSFLQAGQRLIFDGSLLMAPPSSTRRQLRACDKLKFSTPSNRVNSAASSESGAARPLLSASATKRHSAWPSA